MLFGGEFPDGRHEFARDLHHGLGMIVHCSCIFCHNLLFRLLFIMRKDSTDSCFVPTWREFALRHTFLLRGTGKPSKVYLPTHRQ